MFPVRYEQIDGSSQLRRDVPFAEWDNPYFPAATPGSIAAGYYELMHLCYPLPRDDELRSGQIAQIVQFLQREGKSGADKLALVAAGMAAPFPDNAAVQKQAAALMKELAGYDVPGKGDPPRQKAQPNKSRER